MWGPYREMVWLSLAEHCCNVIWLVPTMSHEDWMKQYTFTKTSNLSEM